MKKHYIFLLLLSITAFSSCSQNNTDSSAEPVDQIESKDYSFTDSLFLAKLNSKGLFPFEKNEKFGFKDKSGNIIVEAKYDIIPGIEKNSFTYGLYEFLEERSLLVGIKSNISVNDGDEYINTLDQEHVYGLIDINGKELVKPSFELIVHPDHYSEDVVFFEEGLLGVYFPKQKKINTFMNSKGEIFDLSIYTSAKPINSNLIRVEKNGNYGVVTKQGELKVPIIYDGVQVNSNLILDDKSLIEVCNDCRWINSTELCGSGDDATDRFVKGKHGIVDENGSIIIPLAYEAILTTNKVAFLNKGGKIILDRDCDFFVGGQWEIYDSKMNKHTKTKFKALVELNTNLFAVNLEEQISDNSSKGKWGIINSEGKEILPLKYDSIYIDYDDNNNNKIIAEIGDNKEVFIWNGKKLTKGQ